MITRRRRSVIAIGCLLIALSLLTLAFRNAGRSLVTADSLQPAQSVVVLGGQLPFRAMEAAGIYRQGWAPEVWLTQGPRSAEELALERLAIAATSEDEYSRRVLERLGVPGRAVRVLPERNADTADEVRAIARELRSMGGSRVIIVTSRSHTRRVKVLWHALIGKQPELIVRYAADDPFEPARWWRNSRDAMSVAREWFGLLNVWTGFPVKSGRR